MIDYREEMVEIIYRSRQNYEGEGLIVSKILSIPIVDGKKCDKCKNGWYRVEFFPWESLPCTRCGGTGKLPPVTIENIIRKELG